MRLTLRTLLAWMDDLLPATDANEIGKQVAEAPAAQELAERIQRVVRQRRLTVPEDSGADGADPNTTAAYLEDQLSGDEVIEFEKRCLTSDVHLAETASVHQVLSLLGHKAKVPPAARHRMYRLIKSDGQQSNALQNEPSLELSGPVSPKAPPLPEPEPASPGAAARRVFAGLGLAAAVAIAAWMALSPAPRRPSSTPLLASNANPNSNPNAASPAQNGDGKAANGAGLDMGSAAPAPADGKTNADPNTVAEAKAEAAKGADASADAAKPALADDGKAAPAPAPAAENAGEIKIADRQGVIFRRNGEKQAWEPFAPNDPKMPTGERLAIVEPSRLALTLGGGEAVVLGASEWKALPPGPNAARIELTRGRWILNAPVPPKPYEILVDSAGLGLTIPPGGRVGVEPVRSRQPGGKRAPSEIRLACSLAGVKLTGVGGKEHALGQGTYQVGLADESVTLADPKAPSWLENDQLNGLEKEIAREFSKFFVDSTVSKALLNAVEDPKDQIRRAGIKAFGALGQIDLVMDLLAKPNSPLHRQAAIETLRGILDQGGDVADQVGKDITDRYAYDENVARTIRKLLDGYSADELRADPKIANQLVGLLESQELPVRELAIDVLADVTGRDRLGYDADNPMRTANAWKQLLRKGELKLGAPGPNAGDAPNP